jgi:hypothetical protein
MSETIHPNVAEVFSLQQIRPPAGMVKAAENILFKLVFSKYKRFPLTNEFRNRERWVR